MSNDVDNTREYTTFRNRYEVGCACCGVEGHYQGRVDATARASDLAEFGHLDVIVYDHMARRGPAFLESCVMWQPMIYK